MDVSPFDIPEIFFFFDYGNFMIYEFNINVYIYKLFNIVL